LRDRRETCVNIASKHRFPHLNKFLNLSRRRAKLFGAFNVNLLQISLNYFHQLFSVWSRPEKNWRFAIRMLIAVLRNGTRKIIFYLFCKIDIKRSAVISFQKRVFCAPERKRNYLMTHRWLTIDVKRRILFVSARGEH
jgi:hypothetical protein